jgi:hypothetical protein
MGRVCAGPVTAPRFTDSGVRFTDSTVHTRAHAGEHAQCSRVPTVSSNQTAHMRTFILRAASAATLCASAASLSAQASSPVAAAFRNSLATASKNFTGSAERMPEDKYGYKPTPANMTYGAHMAHMADFNEMMCGLIGGAKAPTHDKVTATSPKEAIVSHLRSSFAFCSTALANLDDSQLAATVSFFGSQITRAAAILILSGDWSDHYAVTSTYLRLNGLLPPTAKM